MKGKHFAAKSSRKISNKAMRKNSFIEGTLVAYLALMFTKAIGAVYNIPFYGMIGENGGVIYSTAYNIYAIFLDVTICGIPTAISIVVSEYNSIGHFKSKKKAYSLALKYVSILSVAFFAILQIFAYQLAYFLVGELTEGVSLADIAMGIRAVSFCLLIAPALSVKRGYLLGHKYIGASSFSQVIEQVVHIGVVLIGVYVTIYILNLGVTAGVCLALVSTAIGAVVGFIYIQIKSAGSKAEMNKAGDPETDILDSNKDILKNIIACCLTLTIVSVSQSIYGLADMKLLLVGLHRLNFSDTATEVIASVNSTWVPKISMIIGTLAMGMVSSIAPHMAESYARGDYKSINNNINRAIGTILIIAVPISIGIIIYAEPVYRFFYGKSDYGFKILIISSVLYIFGSITNVVSMAMQSIRKGRIVCVVTIVGILLNMLLDLPWIYLFHYIGLDAYLGATFSSIFAQIITSTILLIYLNRKMHFNYAGAITSFVRIIPAALVMCFAVIGFRYIWPVAEGRGIMLIIQLGATAVVGAAVYLPIAYKTGAIAATLGDSAVDRVLRKLHLKK